MIYNIYRLQASLKSTSANKNHELDNILVIKGINLIIQSLDSNCIQEMDVGGSIQQLKHIGSQMDISCSIVCKQWGSTYFHLQYHISSKCLKHFGKFQYYYYLKHKQANIWSFKAKKAKVKQMEKKEEYSWSHSASLELDQMESCLFKVETGLKLSTQEH